MCAYHSGLPLRVLATLSCARVCMPSPTHPNTSDVAIIPGGPGPSSDPPPPRRSSSAILAFLDAPSPHCHPPHLAQPSGGSSGGGGDGGAVGGLPGAMGHLSLGAATDWKWRQPSTLTTALLQYYTTALLLHCYYCPALRRCGRWVPRRDGRTLARFRGMLKIGPNLTPTLLLH